MIIEPENKNVFIMHSAHLDLFWMGSEATCLEWGSKIIDDAVGFAAKDKDFHFLIETVRFLEYYIDKHPEKKELLKQLALNGQIEFAGDYIDKVENSHDGESLVRNVIYGKKVLKELLGVDTEVCYHPDLPGSAEQTPQILAKSGISYYLAARGFKLGVRIFWKGLDKSRLILYDFPQHYAYYSIEEEVLPYVDEIRKNIDSEDIILSCSAGDLGPANTFSTRENGKWKMVVLSDFIKELNGKNYGLNFKTTGITKALKGMDVTGLKEISGENPSRWGHHASALHARLFLLDKKASAGLMEAEKYSAVCDLLGMPVEFNEPVHPLKHGGYSGGVRKYFDLKFKPSDLKGYIDAGWRYLLVTQDHNYGGVDGAQTQFDRYRYKEAAVTIAEMIKQLCFDRICSCMGSDGMLFTVFNSMNWMRSEPVYFESDKLDPENNYVAVDNKNNSCPILKTGKGYAFFASGVPSFGYKSFRIEKGISEESSYREIKEDKDSILLKNKYYEISIDKKTGSLSMLKDLELGVDLVKGSGFLTITAYEDKSVSVNDNVVDKPVMDESRLNVRSVSITEDNYLWTKVEIITEICNAKTKIEVVLSHYRKELKFKPTIYWMGIHNLQVKMNLYFNEDFKKIVYGVPYGAQKYGDYLESSVIFKEDEISTVLYQRYREVEKWFSMESEAAGICLSSSHSAFDFDNTDVSSTLIRTVSNCGEHDVKFLNEGQLEYEFSLSSYKGSWAENKSFITGWEMAYPLESVERNPDSVPVAKGMPMELSFIDTGENGILTVFKKSEHEEGKYIARIFNTTSAEYPLQFRDSLDLKISGACDFNENNMDDRSDRLESYEIKAVKFNKH